jgi:hypothetical protein
MNFLPSYKLPAYRWSSQQGPWENCRFTDVSPSCVYRPPEAPDGWCPGNQPNRPQMHKFLALKYTNSDIGCHMTS